MNKCHFVGKLTDDPVLYPSGQATLAKFTLAVDLAASGAGVGGLQITSNKLEVNFGTSAGTVLEGNTSLFDGDYGSLDNVPSTFAPVTGTGAGDAMPGNTLTQNSVTLGAAGSNFSFVRPTASAAGNQTLIEGQAGAVGGNAGGNIVLKAGVPTGAEAYGDIEFQYNASDFFKFNSSGFLAYACLT